MPFGFQQRILNRFVYFFTLTSSFKDQAIEQTRTAAQPKLALSRLQQISLPIPPQNEQEQVISKFDDLAGMIRQTEAIYQRKLAALSELKQSLLQKAFAGELT
ncbi:MAG: restriction endonuclease subunit S [Sphingomonadales bacterium]|nr:restriction endonuclease subunit S [Sphingomonadales bacterium]